VLNSKIETNSEPEEEKSKILSFLNSAVDRFKLFTDTFDKAIQEDRELFDVFHATKEQRTLEGSIIMVPRYRVPKELVGIYEKCTEDRIYTEAEFADLEKKVMDYFRNINHFANHEQWEKHHGVQFNLSSNKKVYDYLQELALQGNVYIIDFLIFDALQRTQYDDPSYKEKAEQFYCLVEEPAVLPLNLVYRALIFDEYEELVSNSEPKNLFSSWYVWNMDPKLLLREVNKQKITFKDEDDQMKLWLIQNM
ncbi:Hypothetical protein HVR_LOCUS814, partial [uncultured virus]